MGTISSGSSSNISNSSGHSCKQMLSPISRQIEADFEMETATAAATTTTTTTTMNSTPIDEANRICLENTLKCVTTASTTTRTTRERATTRECKARVTIPRRTKGMFSTTIISLAFISYVISNQMATLILSSSGLTNNNELSNNGNNNSNNNNNNLSKLHSYKLSSFERSLVALVSANPSPEPAPASSSRSATSVSHRMPPMNGSMFGKRSLDIYSRSRAAASKKTRPSNEIAVASDSAVNQVINYNDIITEVIEDFMAKNNEADPSETTAAFCRMIVYECNQLLNHRRTTLSNDNRLKRTHTRN